MLQTTLLLLSTSVLPALPSEPQGARNRPQAPPGMVLVEGGSTRIGSTKEHIEQLGNESKDVLPNVVVELLQFEQRVDDFFLHACEVTNEQYLAFVQATGYRPPELWAEEVINQAQAEFVKEQRKGETFNRARWWRMNWEGKAWKMPDALATLPVVFVDYRDALAYARWAGWRLPTEFEFQRAARGKTANAYPWGDKWEDGRAASNRLRIDRPRPVGSFPTGAVNGLHDLSGNVWEWTSSPFTPYEKFDEKISLEIGKGKNAQKLVTAGLAKWDSAQRVVVGGCYESSPLTLRVTTRRPTERDQSTSAMGFRCASSLTPGADLAEAVLRDDLPPEVRPANSSFDPTRALAIDRWRTRPGTVKVEGYAVVEAYDYFLYVPTNELDGSTVKNLDELTLEHGPVPLGMISVSIAAIEPALEPGVYLVSYRGAGESKPATAAPGEAPGKTGIASQDPEPAQQLQLPEGYAGAEAALLFHKPDGTPVAFLPATDIEMGRPMQPTGTRVKGTRAVPGVNEKGVAIVVQEPVDQLNFKVNSAVKISNKAYVYSLTLKFPEGALGSQQKLDELKKQLDAELAKNDEERSAERVAELRREVQNLTWR